MKLDLKGFERWLGRRKSKATIETYLSCLRTYERFLGRRKDGRQAVEAYMDHLLEAGRAKSTAATHYHAIRSYYRWKRRSGELDEFEVPQPDPTSPKGVTPEQVLKLLKAALTKRNRAIIALLYETGCRRGELVSIDRRDFKAKDRTVVIIQEKSRGRVHRRVIPLGAKSVAIVVEYLEVRTKGSAALFVGRHGRLTTATIRNIVRKAGITAGLGPVHPHQLRHGRATQLANADVHAAAIMDHMGHQSFTTTKKYTHLTIDDLKKKVPPALR